MKRLKNAAVRSKSDGLGPAGVGGHDKALSKPGRPRAQVSDLSNLAPSVKLFDHALLIYVFLFGRTFCICATVII